MATKLEHIAYFDDKTNYKYHENIIRDTIDKAYSQLIHDYLTGVIEKFNFWTKWYHDNEIQEDAIRTLYYVDLPAAIVSLKSPTEGIREINTSEGTDLQFIPLTEHDRQYIQGLDCDIINSDVLFEVNGNKVFFHNMSDEIEKVSMLLAIPFREFEDTDEVVMPVGRDYDITILVLELLERETIKMK